MNDRIQTLRQRLFDADPKICSERCNIFTASMKESEGMPIALRRANAYYDVLDKMTISIQDDEIIVGNQTKWIKSAPIYPEYSVEWLEEEFEGKPYFFDQRPGDRFYYDEETKTDILEAVSYWKGKSMYENIRKLLPEEVNNAWNATVIDDTWVTSQGLGNVVVDYDLVVKKGLRDVVQRIEKELADLDLKAVGTIKKKWFLEAALKSNQAVIRYAERLAEACETKAEQTTDAARKEELLRIANNCRTVPFAPAQTFEQAVQSIFTILMAVHLESNGHAFSLGRFDQYVYPLYKKELDAGTITRERALEIVEAFFIKCNEINKLRSWPDSEFFLGYQMFINLAVGGQTVDGQDAVNEVSHLCVEACADVKLFTPSISIKWFEGTDDAFMMKALEAVMQHQGGQPAFYNDKAFIRTLRNLGIAEEDLVDWCPDGCIEASIPGKWDFAAKGPWLNVEKVLEITLNNGLDPRSGIMFKKTDKKIEDCADTAEILEEYKKMLTYFMDLQVVTEHINDEVHAFTDINAFRASLIDDCIGRGLDLVEGGSRYSVDGGPTAGTISSGDALAAIEEMVFVQKRVTMPELLYALKTNYEDEYTTPSGPEIRAMMLNKAPKYGNDDDRADKWVVAVEDFIGSSYRNNYKSSKFGKGPVPCCYSYSQSPVTGNIAFGAAVGATPDGRKAGMPVNNGISPANGSEKEGATAACNSVAKLPSVWFQKGAIFNMRLTPAALETPENRQKVIDMVKVLFNNYGQQIQFNVVDGKVYKEAMERPDEFKDLMVRVSGYSALFTTLAPAVQQDVINRVELDV
ncbi:MAG: pyruvate formate-lyase [Spartobacteria bacterium]|nr:pyruvate formate-lyase [Spartobacteria bacterium]